MVPADFHQYIANIWLAAGVICMAADVFGITGAGLMFAGLGSLVVGTLIHLGLLATDAYVTQFVVFFTATAVWALLLWRPLQKLRVGKRKSEYHNIIGETAYVGSNGLTKQAGGEVTWSGTIMKAQLAKTAHIEQLDAGSQVIITDVTGATLIVKPKE